MPHTSKEAQFKEYVDAYYAYYKFHFWGGSRQALAEGPGVFTKQSEQLIQNYGTARESFLYGIAGLKSIPRIINIVEYNIRGSVIDEKPELKPSSLSGFIEKTFKTQPKLSKWNDLRIAILLITLGLSASIAAGYGVFLLAAASASTAPILLIVIPMIILALVIGFIQSIALDRYNLPEKLTTHKLLLSDWNDENMDAQLEKGAVKQEQLKDNARPIPSSGPTFFSVSAAALCNNSRHVHHHTSCATLISFCTESYHATDRY